MPPSQRLRTGEPAQVGPAHPHPAPRGPRTELARPAAFEGSLGRSLIGSVGGVNSLSFRVWLHGCLDRGHTEAGALCGSHPAPAARGRGRVRRGGPHLGSDASTLALMGREAPPATGRGPEASGPQRSLAQTRTVCLPRGRPRGPDSGLASRGRGVRPHRAPGPRPAFREHATEQGQLPREKASSPRPPANSPHASGPTAGPAPIPKPRGRRATGPAPAGPRPRSSQPRPRSSRRQHRLPAGSRHRRGRYEHAHSAPRGHRGSATRREGRRHTPLTTPHKEQTRDSSHDSSASESPRAHGPSPAPLARSGSMI